MQDDRHCKACGHLLAMHDKEGCTATFPKPCKCGGAIKWKIPWNVINEYV